MKNHTQLITHVRHRSHAYGVNLTGRFRDLINLEEARSMVDFSLVKAAQRFDPARGVPFYFYARVWVQRDLMAFLHKRIAGRVKLADTEPRDASTSLHHLDGDVLVKQLLNKLTREERSLVRQHVIEGQSLAELARRRNRHRAWACRLLKKALGRLRPFVIQGDLLEDTRPRISGLIDHAVTHTKVAP